MFELRNTGMTLGTQFLIPEIVRVNHLLGTSDSATDEEQHNNEPVQQKAVTSHLYLQENTLLDSAASMQLIVVGGVIRTRVAYPARCIVAYRICQTL